MIARLRDRAYRTPLSVCLCVGFFLFVFASAAWAQENANGVTGAKSILDNAIEVSQQSEDGLNELWEMTFTGSFSPAYNATANFARQIMVIPFFWLFIPISKAFIQNRYDDIFRHVSWIVLVAMFTANGYALTARLSYGSRAFVNASTLTILEQQVGPVTMQDALRDALLTEEAKSNIQRRLAECEAKEGDEQLKCFEAGARQAEADIARAENSARFPGLVRLRNRLSALIGELEKARETQASEGYNPFQENVEMSNTLLNFYFQSAGQALAQQLMKSFQNAMVTMMDVGYFLTAMLGPVAVAASLAPLRPRVLFIWLTGFFSFALMKMSYNILIGAIATVALLVDATDFGSTGLLMAMGVLSPIIAMSMAAWGGTRVVHAMTSGASVIASVIPIPLPKH